MNTEQRSHFPSFLWKVPAVAAVYFVGTMIGAAVVTNLGLKFPEMPGQTYVPILGFLTALVLATCFAFLARDLDGTVFKRWLILTAFLYTAYVVNNQIEAAVFTTIAEVPTMLLFFVFPCTLGMAAAVSLIPSRGGEEPLRSVFSDRPASSWWWRVVLAWFAFPVIYYFFGALIYPLVADIWTNPSTGLRVPHPLVVVGAVSVRSLLFLVTIIPILINWKGSRRGLVLSLGAALAAMVGVAGMFESTWMPLHMKLVHGIEIIADSLVHAWVLVLLLAPSRQEEAEEMATSAVNQASLD